MPPCLANYIFLVEAGLPHEGKASLERLTSGDQPDSAPKKCWGYLYFKCQTHKANILKEEAK